MKAKIKRAFKIIGGYLYMIFIAGTSIGSINSAVYNFVTLCDKTGWRAIIQFMLGLVCLACFICLVYIGGRLMVLGLKAAPHADNVDCKMTRVSE